MQVGERAAVRGRLAGEWASHGDAFATGYAFSDGEGRPAVEVAAALDAASDVEATLRDANGFFAAVLRRDDDVHLFCDRAASHTLFYGQTDEGTYFSDDAAWVREQVGDDDYDPVAELEYLLSGYVTGHHTLSPGVFQVRCGEHVTLSHGDPPAVRRWFEFPTTRPSIEGDQRTLLRELDAVIVDAYRRLIEYADGRPIVVSLSAGHDSRLNLLMLSRLGYEDVIALSYAETDAETDRVKRIADDLGVPWVYVPETHQQWYDWYHSAERERFEEHSGYLDRIPAIGSVLGVKTARDRELVPDDAVFVTGDGVMSTGEHISPAFLEDGIGAREVLASIARSHYKFWDWGPAVEEVLLERMRSSVGGIDVRGPDDAVRFSEHWDWQERQSKFIPRNFVFEFWDFDWWMPLWDAAYIDFWDRLPRQQKFDKRLHRRYVESLYRDVAGVTRSRTADATWSGESFGQKLKHRLRHTKLDPTGTGLDRLARKVYFNYVDPRGYPQTPIYGIMPREQYETLQTGLLSIHGFQALEVLDRVSFDPPVNYDIPSSMADVLVRK